VSGYARIHRSLLGHPAFRNDAEALAFAWLVVKAAWKPARVRYKDRILTLGRGQLAISQRDMAAALDRDKGWVERLWKRLKDEAMIEADVKAGVAVITICNYDEYQASEPERKAANEAGDDAEARQAQGTEQIREEVKNISSEPKGSSPRAKFPAPDGVSDEQWDGFRKQRKKPLNARSYRLVCNKLVELAEDGWPPGEMVDLAIERGWETVFAPRTFRHERPDSNPTSTALARVHDALRGGSALHGTG
jgi:hypothetical protein